MTTQAALPRDELIKLYRNAVARGVPLEEVETKIAKHVARLSVSEKIEAEHDKVHTEALKKQLPNFVRIGALAVPIVFIIFGIFLVGNAVFPIVSAFLGERQTTQVAELLTPVPRDEVMDVTPLIVTQAHASEDSQPATASPRMIDVSLDYTNLANWFDAGVANTLTTTQGSGAPSTYIIDIPKLKIENAEVAVGGSDLNHSLIAYPGTALPGEYGAPVVFGHSVLRQFYNPNVKNPRRYTSIFSTIMTLKKGDEIYVTYDGVKYTYIVQEKTEVKPTDVYILSQQFDAQRLKLVTCTPEGTYLRRGVITAQLVSQQ